MGPSPGGFAGDGANKKTPSDGGVLVDRRWARSLSRASISSPREGDFFRQRGKARIRDHWRMMIGDTKAVNRREPRRGALQKKAGLERARLQGIGHVRPTQSPSK